MLERTGLSVQLIVVGSCNRLITIFFLIFTAPCSEKMLVMMACWKRNEFRENTCNEEYNAFAKCMADVRVSVTYM